ncbi:MAG: RNA-directed DNA polymerase [Candidatus Nomurabacteria bacterium]|jgi:hypothetical protein|nr:RNA-directed DNA polymerase [Candidatus Nomurabacteria bacterium]
MPKLCPESVIAEQNKALTQSGDTEELKLWLANQLYTAFMEARKNKRNTQNEQAFETHRDRNIALLVSQIINRTYKPSRGVAFIIKIPVIREIFAATFRDRVIHHLLIQICGDFWEKRLSSRSFSCREGKGTLAAIKQSQRDLSSVTLDNKQKAWIMKTDFQGYFMSLPRKYLYWCVEQGLRKQFPNGGVIFDLCLYLWHEVIFDDPTKNVRTRGKRSDWDRLPKSKSLFHAKKGCGIVIGNLTSQWLSNIALDFFDRFIQRELGCKYYGRYVDDAYYMARSKTELLHIRKVVIARAKEIGLTIHPKKLYLQPASQGLPLLGVVIRPNRTVIGKRWRYNLYHIQHEIKLYGIDANIIVRLRSYQGLAKHYNYKKTFTKIFGNQILTDLECYKKLGL